MFDVIIVGGRIAGASLAHRLGTAGLKVCILERSTFPSYPAVSTPFLLPHTLAELDDLGLSVQAHSPGAPTLHDVVLSFGTHFTVRMTLPEVAGRSSFVVADRADLDDALWQALAALPTVERREGTSVTGVLRDDDGVVCGVQARHDGRPITLRGRLVVGADGRFSKVAQSVGAEVVHQRTDVDTTIYYAFWEGVAPYDDGEPVAHILTTLDGWSAVFMPMSRGRVSVVVQCAAELHEAEQGSAQQIYERALHSRADAARRLAGATRVSKVSGIKRMGNLFREAAGPGWALVGDAFHQKDSIDAQGIYDALLQARLLADQVVAWHGGRPWSEAGAAYEQAATDACRPMFDATMERVKREVHDIPPPLIAKTVLRWVLTDPAYAERFGAVVTRQHDPSKFLTPGLMLGGMARGVWRDLTGSGR
jgi:2-polyprenyl-6-methoxyphenol hydroxylase-like FAD-dependent oxidoreductase